MRSIALFCFFCLPLFAPCLSVASASPSYILILVDDLGYMDVGANNPNCFYETPRIDELAATGMRFTDGYAANPVCSPSRFAIQTGRHPSRVDATNFFSGRRSGTFLPAPLHDRMDLQEVTLAEALKQQGYATMFAGKWHLGPTAEFWPTKQGYDINAGGFNKGGPYGGKKYFSPYGNPRLSDGPAGEHLPDRLASEVCAFMEANQNKPFFACLSFYSVHTPLIGRPDLVAKYKKKAADINGEQFGDEEQVFGKKPRKVRILQKHAVYGAMVEAMDAAVGKVMDKVKALGLDNDVVIAFTSDNGGLSTSEGSPTSNLPLRGGKGWIYEGGIREAFIVRWPGVTTPGSTSAEPVVGMDFFTTFLAAAGGTPAGVGSIGTVDGVNLRPALAGGSLEREALYFHYPHYSNQGGFPSSAIRMGDWKLVERLEDGRVHLYNLKDDIGEQTDIAPKHPDRVKTMRAKLHAWYKEVDAKFLQPKKGGEQPWRP